MVIVLAHTLASVFFYARNRLFIWWNQIAPRAPSIQRDSIITKSTAISGSGMWSVFSESELQSLSLQDVFIPILDATNLTELKNAVQCVLKQCLSSVENSIVFLKDPATQQIEANGITLPRRGLIWKAFQQHTRKAHLYSLPQDADPVFELLGLEPTDACKVLILPLIGRRDYKAGILVASLKADDISSAEEKYLELLAKQTSVTYEAVKLYQDDLETENLHLESLMSLCGELHDQDAATLELKVIKYLCEQTFSESGFLLLVVPETLELISQVVGNSVLPEEVRFPGLWSCFRQALETKQPMFLEHILQDRREEVENIVHMTVHSFLCVPVARKGSDTLIALVCLVNKTNGQRFGEEDIQCVRQCFKYTATVLTSTLAFQNERKLKNQTQALLHVARKLFTRLGEWLHEDCITNSSNQLAFHLIHCMHSFRIKYPVFIEESEISNESLLHHSTNNSATSAESHGKQNFQISSPVDSTDGTKQSLQKTQENWSKNLPLSRSDFLEDPSTETSSTDYVKFPDASQIQFSDTYRNMMFLFDPLIKEIANEKDLGTENVKFLPGTSVPYFPSLRHYSPRRLSFQTQSQKVQRVTNISLSRSTDFPEKFFDSKGILKQHINYSDKLQPNNIYKPEKSLRTVLFETDIKSSKVISDSDLQKPKDKLVPVLQDNPENTRKLPITELLQKKNLCLTVTSSETDKKTYGGSNISLMSLSSDNSLLNRRANELSEMGKHFQTATTSSKTDISCTDEKFNNSQHPSLKENTKLQNPVISSSVLLTVSDIENMKDHSVQDFDIHRSSAKSSLELNSQLTVPTILLTQSSGENISKLQQDDKYIFNMLESLQPKQADYSDGDFFYDLTKLLREIMQEARNLTNAERCSVFLLDKDTDELVATVFDGITTNNKEVQAEIRLPKNQGIAGHVATTGTLLNIKDAYSHPLFYRGVDDTTGFRTRNILCFPIKDEEEQQIFHGCMCQLEDFGVVLGVAQLCNKMTGTYFTTFDEDIASAFAVYCCISISHSLMYKKVIDIQYRNSLANELMMFHMKCLIYKKLQDSQHRNKLTNELMIFHMQQIPPEEVHQLAVEKIPAVKKYHPDFDLFSFPPRSLAETQTPLACLAMFDDLGFINRWRLKGDTLARFVLMVKKGYRNPPYHNWMHAFAVAHFGYLVIKNLKLFDYLEDIELFAFFVSCLCHDIDHRGTTNSFQVKSQSVLAALYSSEGSVMERHHLAQSMCILNTEGSNIFENLTSKEYQQILDLMKDIILATDVAHHLRIFTTLESMAIKGYDKTDPKCHHLLLCLLMTAADLSDQTKNWNNTKHIAVLIYQEFFSQGDLEKALGESPVEMMDRERACVPDLQIDFLDNIAIPVYRVLSMIFPGAATVADRVLDNRKHWVRKAQLLKVHNNSAQTMSVQEIIALGEEQGGEMEMDTAQQNGQL